MHPHRERHPVRVGPELPVTSRVASLGEEGKRVLAELIGADRHTGTVTARHSRPLPPHQDALTSDHARSDHQRRPASGSVWIGS